MAKDGPGGRDNGGCDVTSDRAEPRHILAIDIGGTKLAVGVVHPTGNIVHWERIPTMVSEGPGAVIARLVELCRRVVDESGVGWAQVAAGGVGCGGPMDAERRMVLSPPNLPGWDRIPLVERLHKALGVPMYMDNDANAAALGEHRYGAGRGISNMVYFTVSTGIGGGVIIGNRLLHGENGNAAELGHMSVAYEGRRCHCGSYGCLEAYASGTSIAARAREATAADGSSTLAALAGGLPNITAETVVAAAKAGDRVATAVWDETITILSAGVANAISCFNPRRVILGGGVSQAGEFLFAPLRRRALARVMPPLAEVVDIVPAELGDLVGVMGAAAVALQCMDC